MVLDTVNGVLFDFSIPKYAPAAACVWDGPVISAINQPHEVYAPAGTGLFTVDPGGSMKVLSADPA